MYAIESGYGGPVVSYKNQNVYGYRDDKEYIVKQLEEYAAVYPIHSRILVT